MTRWHRVLAAISLSVAAAFVTLSATPAQQQTGAANTPTGGTPPAALRTADELKVLVAPIALYPDELVAVISQAALYPLQIVEAERYLQQYAKDKSLKPKADWDSSVISLLNYPEIVKQMSRDLDWTQQLGSAIVDQQKDVLVAIQQLRHEAVEKDIIKSDDKIKVTEEENKVIIQSAVPDKIYVPQYEPEMLYVADYRAQPISYYPEAYPDYWYPTAPFFAAAVTGAAWAAAIDWNDWGVWGGRWGNDIDVDCNHCFNNRDFNGKVNFNDIDWRNVDRSKININRDQSAKFSQSNIRNSLERNGANNLGNRAANIRNERKPTTSRNAGNVRKSTLEGLKGQPGQHKATGNKQISNKKIANKQNANRAKAKSAGAAKATAHKPNVKTAANVNRPSGKARPTSGSHNRPKKPSGVSNPRHGKMQNVASNRGAHAMRAAGHGRHGMTAYRPRHQMAGARRGGGQTMGRGGFRGGGGGFRGGGRRR